MGERSGAAQVGGDFEECVLDCGLSESDIGDVALEIADPPGER